MKPVSLTLRLFLCVLALNILTMCVVGMLGLRSANLKISEEYDAQLITETNVLWQIVHEDVQEGQFEEINIESKTPLLEKIQVESLLKYAQWRAFRVWKDDKQLIRSDNAEDMPQHPFTSGFSDTQIDGETWRVFSLHDPETNMVVETFENLQNRELLQQGILYGIVGPLTFMLPLFGLLFSFAIAYGLKGLRMLTRRLSARSPSDLSRLPSDDLPKELVPLALAVNTLLSKLEASLAHEREFIDHAAHELRTPLSALKLQAQLLAKSVTDPEPQASLDALLASVDRTSRLVDQLLLLSRVVQQEIVLEHVELYDIVKETIGMYAVRIVDKHINLALQGEPGMTIQAQPELVRILVGTILDNAIKYTPQGGEIKVDIARDNANVTLSIADNGEGIPEGERLRVFDRFYRVPHTRQSGSGLGLAIASQIAGQFHATIRLESTLNDKGLRAIVAFSAT